MTDRLHVLSQGEIEGMIGALVDELEDETNRYAMVEELAAESEADFKQAWAVALVRCADETAGLDRNTRPTSAEREAIADTKSVEQFRSWKVQDARRRASKEALNSIRARLDALRTLSANVRSQT